jgi:hypothetical protein
MEKKLFAVSIDYLRGSGSKHRYEEVRLIKAESSEQAIKSIAKDKEDTEDTDDFEYEAEEVDFKALERGEDQRIYGRYHN